MASSMWEEASPQARALCAVSRGTSTCSTLPSGRLRNGESSGSHFRVRVECTLGSREQLTKNTGISTICARLMGMFGPFDGAELGLPARLVHAAVTGKPPSFEDVFFGNADDATDLLYIKDMARAIALLQTAEKLQYDVYNISSGKLTPNRELVEVVQRVVPTFTVNLPPGRFQFPPLPLLETKRLQADTGLSPSFDTQSAIRHYVDWLKAGNPK